MSNNFNKNLSINIPSSSSSSNDNTPFKNNKLPVTPYPYKNIAYYISSDTDNTDTDTNYTPPSTSSSYNSYHCKIYPLNSSIKCLCINDNIFNNLCNCNCSFCFKIHSRNKNYKISSRIFSFFQPLFSNFTNNSSFFITLTTDSLNVKIYIFLDLLEHSKLSPIITNNFSLSFPHHDIININSIKNILNNLFFFNTISFFSFSSQDMYLSEINFIKSSNNLYYYETNSFL
jgi:hypothetical protein